MYSSCAYDTVSNLHISSWRLPQWFIYLLGTFFWTLDLRHFEIYVLFSSRYWNWSNLKILISVWLKAKITIFLLLHDYVSIVNFCCQPYTVKIRSLQLYNNSVLSSVCSKRHPVLWDAVACNWVAAVTFWFVVWLSRILVAPSRLVVFIKKYSIEISGTSF